MPAPPKLK
ncbi:hypothetical protein ACHAWX_001879 [Stephanocyclus meneghinianus]